jgi:hypothetical protein
VSAAPQNGQKEYASGTVSLQLAQFTLPSLGAPRARSCSRYARRRTRRNVPTSRP